jgi:hypothetical protein
MGTAGGRGESENIWSGMMMRCHVDVGRRTRNTRWGGGSLGQRQAYPACGSPSLASPPLPLLPSLTFPPRPPSLSCHFFNIVPMLLLLHHRK